VTAPSRCALKPESNTGQSDNAAGHDASRKILNSSSASSGLDGVEDFDAATLDPTTGNMRAGVLTQQPIYPSCLGIICIEPRLAYNAWDRQST